LTLPGPSPEILLLLLSGLEAAAAADAAACAGCSTTVVGAGALTGGVGTSEESLGSLGTSLITCKGSTGQVVLAVAVAGSAVESVSDTPFQSSPVLCCKGVFRIVEPEVMWHKTASQG
jgi:hypothetical protein